MPMMRFHKTKSMIDVYQKVEQFIRNDFGVPDEEPLEIILLYRSARIDKGLKLDEVGI